MSLSFLRSLQWLHHFSIPNLPYKNENALFLFLSLVDLKIWYTLLLWGIVLRVWKLLLWSFILVSLRQNNLNLFVCFSFFLFLLFFSPVGDGGAGVYLFLKFIALFWMLSCETWGWVSEIRGVGCLKLDACVFADFCRNLMRMSGTLIGIFIHPWVNLACFTLAWCCWCTLS